LSQYPQARMLIGGDWRMTDPRPVYNPFTETEIGIRAHAGKADARYGSVPVGRHLSALAGAHMKPVLMELGGHSPVFISDTADIDAAADASLAVKAANAGQMCISPTRSFVMDTVYDRFATRLAERAKALRVGSRVRSVEEAVEPHRNRTCHSVVSRTAASGARAVSKARSDTLSRRPS
jgi:acyl-CoA reductase-like NAD-dependent aldehyde dehydrogenase